MRANEIQIFFECFNLLCHRVPAETLLIVEIVMSGMNLAIVVAIIVLVMEKMMAFKSRNL